MVPLELMSIDASPSSHLDPFEWGEQTMAPPSSECVSTTGPTTKALFQDDELVEQRYASHVSASEALTGGARTQSVWQGCLNLLRQQMSRPSYETWIHTLRLESFSTAGHAVLSTASEFNRNYIRQHYRSLLNQVLATVTGIAVEVDFCVRSAEGPTEGDEADESGSNAEYVSPVWPSHGGGSGEVALPPQDNARLFPIPVDGYAPLSRMVGQTAPLTQRLVNSQLNPRYTFDALVVGAHNRLAHAAAMAIAQHPGQHYNPFFIYGPSGLGKTHILQAIGHAIHQNHPSLRVQYLTAEEFTNGLIHAIGHKQMKPFRERYRNVDVLLIDDVQFLEGKERTQEEMFHTFNTLHQAGKQIVLTSDRPARALADLEDRLRSRFEWGLMADISPPDIETRLAILLHKLERDGMLKTAKLASGTLQTLAELIPGNVRELEGALTKLAVVSMLESRAIEPGDVPGLLGLSVQRALDTTTHLEILQAVAAYYHLKVGDLQGPCRGKDIVHARQVAFYLLRELLNASYPKMGEWMGNRRHSSALYAVDKASKALATSPLLQRQVEEIKHQIKARQS
jgi:chromosomal replication initiator protein